MSFCSAANADNVYRYGSEIIGTSKSKSRNHIIAVLWRWKVVSEMRGDFILKFCWSSNYSRAQYICTSSTISFSELLEFPYSAASLL